MITTIIGTLWRMSLRASVLILFILAVRPFLKRYPKIYSYSLWILVGVSLLCPISIPSPFSLQPNLPDSMTFLEDNQNIGTNVPSGNTQNPAMVSGAPSMPSGQTGATIQPDDSSQTSAHGTEPDNKTETWSIIFRLLCILYLTGAGIVSLCCFMQYRRVRRQIATAILDTENVWLCETVQSPFVIGIRKPRILLPYGLAEPEKSYILKHEKTHIRHHDPLARLIGLICLCLHWWNPLVWLASHFMEQDMEMFCDESTLQNASLHERKAYAKTLLSFAKRQSGLTNGLAFGETNTERRVKNIMKVRKNNLVILSCVILLAVFCVIAFMTIPKPSEKLSEQQEAPIHFSDFALQDGTVYQGLPEDGLDGARPLPVATDYCAIYNNELFYATEHIDQTIGQVEDGHLSIYRCGLDGTNQQKILELPEIYMVADMMLQDGYLYCTYIKTEDDDMVTIAKVRTSGEDLAEYQRPEEYGGIFLFGKDRAYSRYRTGNGELTFYVHYLETGKTEELYRCSGYFLADYCVWNGKLLLLLDDNKNLTLLGVDEDKNITDYGSYTGRSGSLLSGKSTYCSMDTTLYRLDEKQGTWIPLENLLPAGVQPYAIRPLEEEGDNLYYIVSGETEDDEWKNTFLMQYDPTSGESKLLRAYYSP